MPDHLPQLIWVRQVKRLAETCFSNQKIIPVFDRLG